MTGSIRNSTTNTPEECITFCNATGYAYAGLQEGIRCLCFSEEPQTETDPEKCNMKCALVSALLRDMNMPALSMGRSAFAPTLGHKEPARKGCAIINVQATAPSECAEGSGTSTCSTPMITAPNGPHAQAAET